MNILQFLGKHVIPHSIKEGEESSEISFPVFIAEGIIIDLNLEFKTSTAKTVGLQKLITNASGMIDNIVNYKWSKF